MKPNRVSKYYYRRIQRLKGDPYALAGGFAVGVFIGITPTMPLHTIIIILITLATRTSTIAGILSSWLVCNPLTYFPIYYFSLVIGNKITPYHLNWEKIKAILDVLSSSGSLLNSIDHIVGLGYQAVVVLLAGGVLLALPFTVVSYYFALRFFIAVKKRRIEKHVLN